MRGLDGNGDHHDLLFQGLVPIRMPEDGLIFSCLLQPVAWHIHPSGLARARRHDLGFGADDQEFFVVDKFFPDRVEVAIQATACPHSPDGCSGCLKDLLQVL